MIEAKVAKNKTHRYDQGVTQGDRIAMGCYPRYSQHHRRRGEGTNSCIFFEVQEDITPTVGTSLGLYQDIYHIKSNQTQGNNIIERWEPSGYPRSFQNTYSMTELHTNTEVLGRQ